MNMGIPVAFFVSDPRLCATGDSLRIRYLQMIGMERTPSNNDTNGCICSTGDAECREIFDFVIGMDSQ
jgi:hypothetical protein